MEFNEAAIRPLIGLCGMIFLGLAFNSKMKFLKFSASIGWLLVGLYFGLSCPYYIEINDPVLVLMTGFAPLAGIYLAYYEIKKILNLNSNDESGGVPEHLIWLRGMIFLAGTPYLLVSQIPYLNKLAILFVAWQVVLFMRWTGSGDITLG